MISDTDEWFGVCNFRMVDFTNKLYSYLLSSKILLSTEIYSNFQIVSLNEFFFTQKGKKE